MIIKIFHMKIFKLKILYQKKKYIEFNKVLKGKYKMRSGWAFATPLLILFTKQKQWLFSLPQYLFSNAARFCPVRIVFTVFLKTFGVRFTYRTILCPQATGTSTLKAAKPKMVSRYFSA